MSFDSKFRFHMGCGESLQCRWRVIQLRRMAADSRDASVNRPGKRRAPGRAGAKCKL